MSRTRRKKEPGNTPVKTAIPASYATMTAAGYASTKNPVTAAIGSKTNLNLNRATIMVQDCFNKRCRYESTKLLF